MNSNKKVLVSNIPSHVSEDEIDLIFSSSKYGENTVIERIEIKEQDKKNNYVLIEYANEEVATRVVEFGPFEVRKVKYDPKLYDDNEISGGNAVIVKDVEPDDVLTLILIYENKRKSGGGEIEAHEYDEKTGELVLFFKEESTAKSVLNFGSVKYNKKTYKAHKYEMNSYDNAVIIENVSKILVDDLALAYENEKKTGGGSILTHIYNSDENALIIHYEDPAVAKRVIAFGEFTYKNNKYKAKLLKKIKHQNDVISMSQSLASIEILNDEYENAIGIENISEDDVETAKLLFESKKAGGGPIKSHEFIEDMNVLIIFFEYPKTAKNVLKHETITHADKKYHPKTVSIEWLKMIKKETKDGKKIMVRNVEEKDVGKLLLLFESAKRTGGGPISTYLYDEDFKSLMIEFEEKKHAKNSINFGRIEFDGKYYKAESINQKKLSPIRESEKMKDDAYDSYTLSNYDDFKFKLIIYKNDENISNLLDYETLRLYIDLLLDHEDFKFHLLNYYYDEDVEGTIEYLVVSEHIIFFEKVLQRHKKKAKLVDRTTEIERVEETSCILVKCDFHQELVEMYFQNTRESGGGDIKSFKKINTLSNGSFIYLIEFEDKRCIERILNKNSKIKMEIQPFYDDIKRFETKLALKLKEKSIKKVEHKGTYTIQNITISEFPYSFIAKHKEFIQELELYLKTFEANLIQRENIFQVEYLESKITNQQLMECLDTFTKSNFSFHEWSIENDILDRIKPKLDIFYNNSTNVALSYDFENKEKPKIRIEGDANAVKAEIHKINIVISDNNNKIEIKREYMESYKCSLLMRNGFILSSKKTFPEVTIKIIPVKGTVIFHGFVDSVYKTQDEMDRILNSLHKMQIKITYPIGKFLNDRKDYVEQCLEDNKLICEYEVHFENKFTVDEIVDQSCSLCLYAIEETYLYKTNKYISDTFKEFKYDVELDSLELLDTLYPQFLEFNVLSELKHSNEHDHLTFIESKTKRKVWCAGEKLVVQSTAEKIADFFHANTLLTKYCNMFTDEELRYLNVVKSKEIPNICVKLHKETKSFVATSFEVDNNDASLIRLKVTGTQRTLDRLIREMQKILNEKIVDYHAINDNNVIDLFTNDKGKRNLVAIENETECLIVNTKDTIEQVNKNDEGYRTIDNLDTIKDFVHEENIHGVKIRVINRNLWDLPYVDVITIGSHQDLRPFDDLSQRLINQIGVGSIEEIKSVKSQDIFEGEAYIITSITPRSCKKILYAVVPKRIEEREEILYLNACIKDCLKKASDCSSIALPLFYSTKYENNELMRTVIEGIIYSIMEYLSMNQNSKLKEIYISDDRYSNTVIECLKRTMRYNQVTVESNTEPEVENVSKPNYNPISLEIGTILDPAYEVDAIVNTTSYDLVLSNGTVSKLILQKAGNGIQQELKTSYPNGLNNNLLVAVSTGGNIKGLKYIFHIALDSYDTNKKIETNFRNTVLKLLEEAENRDCRSIAMPAFGTGILKYPRDKVAQWMFTSINHFFNKSKPKSLKKVLIILFEKDTDTIKEFKNFESQKNNKVVIENTAKAAPNQKTHKKAANDNQDKAFYSDVTKNKSSCIQKFSDVKIEVYQGNIVDAKDDVIINPTDSQFQLGGKVSQELLRAGGNSLVLELPKSRKLDENGVFWSLSGNLRSKQILHVDVQTAEIRECVITSLLYVDEAGYESVVYPVIGTGFQLKNTKTSIKEMLDGFSIFIQKVVKKRELNIKSIKVCIFNDDDMLNTFHEEMKELAIRKQYKASNWMATMYKKAKSFFNQLTKGDIQIEPFDSGFGSIKGASNFSIKETQGIKFKLMSDEKSKIEKARQQIIEMINSDKLKQYVKHDFIKSLNENQMKQIQKICSSHSVNAKDEIEMNRIQLIGRNIQVAKCVALVNELLNTFMMNNLHEAQEIAREIQWEYCVNDKWQQYNIYTNLQIEATFQNKSKTLEFDDENDEKCYIDFGMMAQYRKATNEKIYMIRRIDLKNKLDFKVPTIWESNKACDLIEIASKTNEFQNILKFVNKNKFGNRTIISIQRVQNLRLYIQYQAHKNHFETRDINNVNERILFHGTTGDSVTNIWKFGFNRSYCGKNATAFGRGVYFAKDASYSHGYTNLGNVGRLNASGNILHGHMFLCKVLIGYSAVGTPATEGKTLPKAPDGQTPVDSTVNNIQNPSIFVIYHDAQAYPEYLITYQ